MKTYWSVRSPYRRIADAIWGAVKVMKSATESNRLDPERARDGALVVDVGDDRLDLVGKGSRVGRPAVDDRDGRALGDGVANDAALI